MSNQLRPFAAGVAWTVLSILLCLWLMNRVTHLPGGAQVPASEPASERNDG